ncbi:MAG: VWA domain-containing protein [Betaproteobacteria bacterium]|nr:VWA domain-containing protein [Betaproteobacteria bacterium]
MKTWFIYYRKHRDSFLLGGALFCLIAAMFHPTIPVKHNIYNYFLVADISQSMNAIDMEVDGKPASRIAHMQKLMHEIVSSLPCDTKVSIGLFAGSTVAALYSPINVCENFAAIQDTIDHLDWRTAWSGNSRLRESLYGVARTIRSFPESAQVVFITDGEEAPKLHTFNTRDLTGFQGADGWLLVGVGTEKGVAIPKLSDANQVIGYWSNDSFALQPGIAQVSESTLGVRDDKVAGANDRYLSKHHADYMKSVAREIGASYIYGDRAHTILSAMQQQKPARRDIAPYDLSWILASLAAFLLIIAYINRHPLQQITETLSLYRKNLVRSQSKRENEIAHDNQISKR